jgi:hypothetical protein
LSISMIAIVLLQGYIGSKKVFCDENRTVDWCQIDFGLLQTPVAFATTVLTPCKWEITSRINDAVKSDHL